MKTILLADDNADMVELVKLVLGNSGYRIVIETDGDSAVAACLSQRPDMVLMDINMPGMDGLNVTRTLRAQGFDRPIVILTASEDEQDRRRAEECGCNGYIIKTMDMAEVEPMVDRFLAEAGSGLD